ncbi:hypothetical protein BH23PAT2_BH23PAT2_04150 [soil metagenome]
MKRKTQTFTALFAGIAIMLPFFYHTQIADAQTDPVPSAPGSTAQQRLEQRKAERSVQFEEREQQRLEQRCTGAQSRLRSGQQPLSDAFENRTKTYEKIDGRLWTIIGQLKLADKDTFPLEQTRSRFVDLTDSFKATATQYTQTYDDLLVINCAADPVGFKALLETARIYDGRIRQQSLEIRTQLIDDTKQTLSALGDDLRP